MTVKKIAKDSERQKKVQAATILQAAKESDSALRDKLETQIHELSQELKTYKESNQKDLEHLKETHNSELKNLGEKIEQLREELRQQSKNILELLTKMIGKE